MTNTKKHEATATAKLKRKHPWRGWMDKPPKNDHNEFNHPALPSKFHRPI